MKTFSTRPANESTHRVACPLCGETGRHGGLNCEGFAFDRCAACGFLYQNPRPSQEALVSRYADEYFDYEIRNEAAFFGLMNLALRDIEFENHTSRFASEKKSFLDVGCATGMLLDHIRSRGWSVRGVEVCEPAARFGMVERNLDIFVGTLEQAAFPSQTFAVVHCSHLIEHLTDPVAFIDECRRLLRDDGYLIVTTPNASGFQARLFGSRWRSAIADHMGLFSKRTLTDLLRNRGFRVVTTKTWGGIAEGIVAPAVKRVADRLAKRCGFGDVMVVLANKASGDSIIRA
jgi:2-polyprenyl-3-methyl-5-hydroxy-6-metoxy-1,4-benzoquinol methylase